MTPYTWKLYRTRNPRFPFRIVIEEDGRTVIAFWTQESWPGARGQIFCLRERPPGDIGSGGTGGGLGGDTGGAGLGGATSGGSTSGGPRSTAEPADPRDSEDDDPPEFEFVESVPIAYLKRMGKRVEIVLDRPRRKRCDFLFLKKPGKDGIEREQIFFRTQAGLREHRAKGRPLLYAGMRGKAEVVIDTREKYPWRFPESEIRKDELPVGDYALVIDNRYAAVVERKSFENMVSDLYRIQILDHQLRELSTYPHAALVIEALYADFSDKARIGEERSPAHLVRLLSEIAVLHPTVRVVFAGNRKLANQWTGAFFTSVARKIETSGKRPSEVMDQPVPYTDAPVDIALEARALILSDLVRSANGFSFKELAERFPQADAGILKRVIARLRGEEAIEMRGKASGARYVIGPLALGKNDGGQ